MSFSYQITYDSKDIQVDIIRSMESNQEKIFKRLVFPYQNIALFSLYIHKRKESSKLRQTINTITKKEI